MQLIIIMLAMYVVSKQAIIVCHTQIT